MAVAPAEEEVTIHTAVFIDLKDSSGRTEFLHGHLGPEHYWTDLDELKIHGTNLSPE